MLLSSWWYLSSSTLIIAEGYLVDLTFSRLLVWWESGGLSAMASELNMIPRISSLVTVTARTAEPTASRLICKKQLYLKLNRWSLRALQRVEWCDTSTKSNDISGNVISQTAKSTYRPIKIVTKMCASPEIQQTEIEWYVHHCTGGTDGAKLFLFFHSKNENEFKKHNNGTHIKFKIMRASTHTLPVSSVPKSHKQ